MEEYLRNIRNEEQSKNINQIKVSGWYPSNLLYPVRVNGRIFNKQKIEKPKDEEVEEFIKSKNDKIEKIKMQNHIIQTNPVKFLSGKKDDFSFTNRLIPLYKIHNSYK